MKSRWALLLALVIGCSVSAFAGPTIGVLDPSCPTSGNNAPPPGSTFFDVTGGGNNVFFSNFTSTANGGGVFIFCNDSSNNTDIWKSVDFATTNFLGSAADGVYTFTATTAPEVAPITCAVAAQGFPQAFLTCTVTITDSRILMDFRGTADNVNGIQPNQNMIVTLNTGVCVTSDTTCTQNTGEWLDSNHQPITVAGGANLTDPNALAPVPEPASLLLLGSGIASVVVRRRRKRA